MASGGLIGGLRTPYFSSRSRFSFSIAPTTSERNSRENFPSLIGLGSSPSAILRRTVFVLIPPNRRPVSSRLISDSSSDSLIALVSPLSPARRSEALLGFSLFAAAFSREYMDRHNRLISPERDPFLKPPSPMRPLVYRHFNPKSGASTTQ
jgi:hypothetical protein